MPSIPEVFLSAQGREVDKTEFDEAEPRLRTEMLEVQHELRDAGTPVVLLLMGDDRVGTQEVLTRLSAWLDPRWIRVHSTRGLTDEQASRPPAWRFWQHLPARGRTTLYVGGWVGAAIRRRLQGGKKKAWRRDLEHMATFEQEQIDDGAALLKLWLHLPPAEHKRRLKRARKDPDKEPLVETVDEYIYGHLDDGLKLGAEVIAQDPDRWIVIDGTDERGRDILVGEALIAAARTQLDSPRSAPAAPDLSAVTTPSSLAAVDLTTLMDPDEYRERLHAAQGEIARLSRRARDEERSCVLAFEGWDAAGKGGTIRRIAAAMTAMDYYVEPIAAPTQEELAHHWLWRFWKRLPRSGCQVIFDRTWYGRVLVERVEGFAEEAAWQRAYEEIVDFETQLVEHGWAVAKFWLHISDAEQLSRFEARADTPYKRYKLTDEDWRNREQRPAYEAAVDEMVARTDRPEAPWHIIAADDKRTARVTVIEAAVDALRRALDDD